MAATLYQRITAEDLSNENFHCATPSFKGILGRALELGYKPQVFSQIIGKGEEGCLVLEKPREPFGVEIAVITSETGAREILYKLYFLH